MCGIAGYWYKNRAPEAAQQWLTDGVAARVVPGRNRRS